jgi:predicted Zn-dependent protease with MMP-like domain
MTRERFDALVRDAIDRIPRRFAREIHNVAIVVEDEPSDELLDEMEIDEDGTLFGLYQGIPLTERTGYGNTLPDRITLFKGPIEDDCGDDEDEIVVEIGLTLIHELGHYFGMEEHEIAPHEDRWLRGEDDPEDAAGDPDGGDGREPQR